MNRRLLLLCLLCSISLLFAGCPQIMVDRIEKLLPPPGYKPRYMNSNVPIDTLERRYREALAKGTIDTNRFYDDTQLSNDSLLAALPLDSIQNSSIPPPLPTDSVEREKVMARWRELNKQRVADRARRDSALKTIVVAPASMEMRSLDDKAYPQRIDIRTSVVDSSGRVILGLAPPYLHHPGGIRHYWRLLSDSCNGLRHAIDSFSVREVRETQNDPYAIAYVIDHSGSMGSVRIRKLREAVRQTMNIMSRGDMVAVHPFAGSVGVDVHLSSDSAKYKNSFSIEKHAPIRGGTAIHDAVIEACKELGSAPKSMKRAVMIFTDGEDNSSRASLSEACRVARDSGVAVYSIAYGLTNEEPLETLSRLTRGRFYRIYSTKEFPFVFADIYRSLKNYYLISYTPPPCAGIHTVDFQLSLPELGVRRLSGHAKYDKSVFTELDTVGSVTFMNLEFEVGKAVIADTSLRGLEEIALTLKSHPTIQMEIRGHTDDRGNDALNLRLSEQRAEAVVDALTRMGVKRDRLRTKGYGSSRPLVPNDSDENRARNRRTEFVIVN